MEVLVSAALGAIILAGVLSTFVFFCRTGVRLGHYSEMEGQARVLMQRFGRDARQASAAVWNTASSLTLTVEGRSVTYAYDAARRRLTRATGGTTQVMAHDVSALRFAAYALDGSELSLADSLGTASTSTKMVQLDLDLSRNTASSANATAQLLSARYVLRNKSST